MRRGRVVFFFSSRRRHTRCSRDWSSDVCSSDLSTRLTSIFAFRRGSLALNLVEESEIGASHMLDLLGERPYSLEFPVGRSEWVLVLRHCICRRDEAPFQHLPGLIQGRSNGWGLPRSFLHILTPRCDTTPDKSNYQNC